MCERKTGTDSFESVPVSIVSSEQLAPLECKARAEFTPDRERHDGAGRVNKPGRVPEGGSIGNTVIEVVAVVSAVRQVERLRHELQVHPLTKLEVLRQPHIELEERISAKGIVLGDGAPLRDAVQPIEAVLGTAVVAGKREVVCGIVRRDHNRVK